MPSDTPVAAQAGLPDEARYAARADPIAAEWAKHHIRSLHLAAKIEAEVAEGLRVLKQVPGTPAYEQQATTLRGSHPAIDAWARAAQDAADAEQVLLAVWPVLVRRDGHPTRVPVVGGEVRLVVALKPTVRWVPGENRRSVRWCIQCDDVADTSCEDNHDVLGSVTVCTACHKGNACPACREAMG